MIDKDPNKVDKKKGRKTYKVDGARFPMTEEVYAIYESTEEDLKQYIILASESTHTEFMKSRTLVTGNETLFFETFMGILKQIGNSMTSNSESDTKEAEPQPLTETLFTVKKPNRNLVLDLPEMPERKRRKQINFINLHTFKDVYLSEERNGSDLKPSNIVFAQTVTDIGTKKETHLESDMLIKNVLKVLSVASNPAENDNSFRFIEQLQLELMREISNAKKQFKTSDLVKFCLNRKKELKLEIDSIYLKLYEKINKDPVKLPSKKPTPNVTLSSEHPNLSILYDSKDLDVHKMKEKISYYKFIDID